MKNILESELYNADIKRAVQTLDCKAFPKSSVIFVTGSTGLICSTVVDLLFHINKNRNLDWKIIAGARKLEKARFRFSEYLDDESFSIAEYDLQSPFCIKEKIDYIIHGAGNAYPAVFTNYPSQTITASLSGLEKLLDYSKTNGTTLLYISSSEVYGIQNNNKPLNESDYGYINILDARSSYPVSKIACETLCASYVKQYNSNCLIVRPGHIYGPTADSKDNRVSSSFMFNAANGNNLVLKSDGKQVRSYCYCFDCASAIITVLFCGKFGEAYNITNKDSICSIREMAEAVAAAGNVSCIFDKPTNYELMKFNPMLNSSLDGTKIEQLGWKPIFSKNEGFEHSVQICKSLL